MIRKDDSFYYLHKDAKVWVENAFIPRVGLDDKVEPYFQATITRQEEKKKEVEVKYVTLNRQTEFVKYERTMPFINEVNINVNDMSRVEDINEVDLLNNLRNRFFSSQISTNVGQTLIVVNPFECIPGVLGDTVIESYIKFQEEKAKDDKKENENPHIYDITLNAIKHLKEYRKNQAIVISGESGAGKTESAKHAMKCITYVFGKSESSSHKKGKISLEDQILDCNPILEAFGNSKTLRNNNSSRFGKYVTINLDVETGKIEGAKINTYLLEKSRVCTPALNERNYHIFYHLLKGASTELLNEIHLTRDPSNYEFLKASNCYEVDGIDDVDLYKLTFSKFQSTGFSLEEIGTIWRILSACLHLGNLKFGIKNDNSYVENRDCFEIICKLLQCDLEALETSLTYNVRVMMGEEMKTPLKLTDSLALRNTLAKELYNRVFNWIVKKLNQKLSTGNNQNDPNKKYIGLLDIFGFENFEENSIEQFCINFTNEKLQQLYINDIFKSEQAEFIKEGLKDYLNEITFKDNQGIIDSMDKMGSGIFQLIDDSCITNKDDKYLFDSIKKAHPSNPQVKIGKLSTNKFTIVHTAKEVEYTTNGFVKKNLDEVKKVMADCLANSKDTVIKYIFMNAVDETEYQHQIRIAEEESKSSFTKKDGKFLGSKFRKEMVDLTTELSGCECHYVRCLKPNDEKRSRYLVPCFVFQQIRYLGILDTIRIRKDGYPSRKKYQDFFFRFEEVCWFPNKKPLHEYKKILNESDFADLAIKCLDHMSPNRTTKDCLIGKTKIFMKQQFYSSLEKYRTIKMKVKEDASLIIQKIWLGHKCRQHFLKMKEKVKYLKDFYRTKKYYIIFKKMKASVIKIQATYRARLMRQTYMHMQVCAYKLQKKIKSFLIRQKVKKFIKVTVFLLRRVRNYLFRHRVMKIIRAKRIVNVVFDKAWGIIKNKYKIFAAIQIQSHVRKFLAKIKHWSKVVQGRQKREEFIRNRAATKIITNFKGYLIRKKIKIQNSAAEKIQGYWKMTKYSYLIKEMRLRVLMLQKNVRTYFARKHAIDKRLAEYFREENQFTDKILFDSSKILFPNLINVSNASASDFFDEDLPKNSKVNNKSVLPEFDPYADPKINPFGKIIDMDIIVNY